MHHAIVALRVKSIRFAGSLCSHHCVWINNCVGHSNYPIFLGYLFTTLWTALYISYLSFRVFEIKKRERGWHRDVWAIDRSTGSRHLLSEWEKWIVNLFVLTAQHLLQDELVLGSLFMFCCLSTVLVFGFIIYQFRFIVHGKTSKI